MPARHPQAAGFAINSYSYTLDHTARAFLDKFADLGFRQFELMNYPGHLWPKHMSPEERRALRRHIEGRGLELVTLNMPNIDVNIAAASEDMRATSLDHLERILHLAGDLGAMGVVVGPGKANPLMAMPREQLIGHFYRALDRLLPVSRQTGARIIVENMPFAFLPGIDELLAALDAYGSDEIGIVYDVANAHFIKEDIAAGLRKCARAGRLLLVHVSDTGQSIYRHDVVGLGTVPFALVPPVLAEIGHTRPTMLEIIAPDADAGIEASIARLVAAGYGATSGA
jgi:sugar phosphate isomerase/epimerase